MEIEVGNTVVNLHILFKPPTIVPALVIGVTAVEDEEGNPQHPKLTLAYIHPERVRPLMAGASWRDAFERIAQVPHLEHQDVASGAERFAWMPVDLIQHGTKAENEAAIAEKAEATQVTEADPTPASALQSSQPSSTGSVEQVASAVQRGIH